MSLTLKILSGPQAGKVFELRGGQTIGRADSDITLNDPKISGRHAKIENGPDGSLVIIDLGSTNGLRVRGEKKLQVKLTPGLAIKIGYTDCLIESGSLKSTDPGAAPPPLETRQAKKAAETAAPPVVETVDLESEDDDPVKISDELPPIPTDLPLELEESSYVEPDNWSAYFSDLGEKWSRSVQNTPRPVFPFSPVIKFEGVRGLHAGHKWELGYGPRTFGMLSLDLILLDPDDPDVEFTVTPEKNGRARFSTQKSGRIKLNGQAVSSELLKDGDLIQIDNTLLKVRINNESS